VNDMGDEDKEPTTYTKEELEAHQEKIGELWGADPDCWHELDPKMWSGIRCVKCKGWFCY